MRIAYIKIGTEVNKNLSDIIEFDNFWKSHENDTGYLLIYINQENKIIF